MSASAIGWIITIVFVAILVIGFFIGFWRGLRKSTANLVFSVIGIIVAFFVTPVITNAILGIQIDNNGTQTPLNQIILEALMSDETISSIIARNPNMETFIEALPAAIANVVVFILVTCAVELVIYIIYRIVASFTFKTPEGKSKHRLWGGAVGVVKTFLLTIFAFMPLAGLIGLYGTVKENDEALITNTEVAQSSILDYVPAEVDEIITGVENSALIKICGIFGLDNATFDYYTQIQVEDNTIYIREEIENVYPIANMAYQLMGSNESLDFSYIDYEKLETYVNGFVEGGLFKGIVVDFLNDVIQNYQEYPFIAESAVSSTVQEVLLPIQTKLQEYSENHDMLEQYFVHDVKYLFQAVKTVAESGLLDQIMAMPSDSSISNYLEVLTSDGNIENTETALSGVLDVNLVRDAISPLTEILLRNLSTEFETINVDTSTWGEQDWDSLSTSVVNVVKDYFDLSEKVDILDVAENPTILITDDTINIEEITIALGNLIDEARAIKLFQNADGESVVDNFLDDFNLSLPSSVVYNVAGQPVEIKNYSDLFEFITPALVEIKENGLYDILNNSQTPSALMSELALLISQEGNENLLSEIILPLSQVEPTNTFVVEAMLQSIQNNIVDFTNLANYQDWKNDLGYISSLLVTLNTLTLNDVTYLELAVNGDIESIINNLNSDNLQSVVKPVLYAKSTTGLRDEIFTIITDVVGGLTESQGTINMEGVTLVENNSEDQADEICDILASFLELNKTYSEGMGLRDIDKSLLGTLLTSMQLNAYRQVRLEKQEVGAFKAIYDDVLGAINTEYQDVIALSSELQQMLSEENYPYINFTDLFNKIEELEAMYN